MRSMESAECRICVENFNFPFQFPIPHSHFSTVHAECGKRGVCNSVIFSLKENGLIGHFRHSNHRQQQNVAFRFVAAFVLPRGLVNKC